MEVNWELSEFLENVKVGFQWSMRKNFLGKSKEKVTALRGEQEMTTTKTDKEPDNNLRWDPKKNKQGNRSFGKDRVGDSDIENPSPDSRQGERGGEKAKVLGEKKRHRMNS